MEEIISATRGTLALWSAIVMTVVEKLALVLLQMPLCDIATGQTLFDALATVLSERGIAWSNVIGFCSNSAGFMVGQHNSVLSRVLNEQPDVFSLGCIGWLSLEHAVKCLIAMWTAHCMLTLTWKRSVTLEMSVLKEWHHPFLVLKQSCMFILFNLLCALLTLFSAVFQTTTSKISTMQSDILDLLRSYLSNFIQACV